MLQTRMAEDLAELLTGEPLGIYLLERTDERLILWRLSDGEPPDGALEPATGWTLADEAALVA